MTDKLRGVIAAITTAVDEEGEPDCTRSVALEQRKQVMTAYCDAGLPLERLMVGTGAASVADAMALTRHAADLGFAGALVLPPFYYKGVPDDGLVAYIESIISATAATPI